MSAYIPALFGILGTILGASITAYYNYGVSRKIKQQDLYRLVRAELLNLARHYRITSREIKNDGVVTITTLRKARYRDSGFMALEAKETFILNENLCQDIMQVVLYSRNNDIEIDHLIENIKAGKCEKYTSNDCKYLTFRLDNTVKIAEDIISHLKKHEKRPDLYNEPQIDW
jgi:hypothetical protein